MSEVILDETDGYEDSDPEVVEEEFSAFRITKVARGMPADKAGLLSGDRVIAVDGVLGADPIIALDVDLANRSVPITIERDGHPIELTITPVKYSETGLFIFGWEGEAAYRLRLTAGEQETWLDCEKYTYHDIKGNPIAKVVADYDPVPVTISIAEEGKEIGKPYEVRRLRSLLLTSPDGSKECDILDCFNLYDVEVLVDETIIDQAKGFDDMVIGRSLRHPEGVSSLIHELRHVWQTQQPLYEKLLDLYEHEFMFDPSKIPDSLSLLEDLKEIVGTVAGASFDFTKVIKSYDEFREIELERETNNTKQGTDEYKTLRQTLALPTQVVERDAEFAALKALRILRDKFGINLLGELPQPYQQRPPTAGELETEKLDNKFQRKRDRAYKRLFNAQYPRPTRGELPKHKGAYRLKDGVKSYMRSLCGTSKYMRRGQSKESYGVMPQVTFDKKHQSTADFFERIKEGV